MTRLLPDRIMHHAIVLTFDDNLADHAIACMNSIKANFPRHPDVLAVYRGKASTVLAALDRLGARRVRPPRGLRRRFAGGPDGPVGSRTVYDRFVLWADGFQGYDNVLYLDVDTLVLAPLDELFRKDGFMAVVNHEPTENVRVFDPVCAADAVLARLLREDGFDYPGGMDDMINAGVMLVPRHCRTPDQYRRLLDLFDRYRDYLLFADQSLLSLWCAANGFRPGRCFEYNYQSPFFTAPDIDIPMEEIRVLHFSGVRKPPSAEFRSWERVGEAAAYCESLFHHYRHTDHRPVDAPKVRALSQ